MHVGIAPEEVIDPELTLPIQFRDLWHGPRAASPETILAVSVLGQAANDLRAFRFARRRGGRRLYIEAYNWVASSDRSWPYAFLNLCDALRLSAECVRDQLGDAHPGAAARFRNTARPMCRRPDNRGSAMEFRLSRPANVKYMKTARPLSRRRGGYRSTAHNAAVS